jgi:IMP dehydrogenase/GMP reductase
MQDKLIGTGLTFDDVLIEPRYSEVVPAEVSVATRLTRRIEMRAPILSSPMDTVTEHRMAIGLAQEGGLSVIHKNMSIEDQTKEVDKVKRSANGIIVDPVTMPTTASVASARRPHRRRRREASGDHHSPRSPLSGRQQSAGLRRDDPPRATGYGHGDCNACGS